MLPESNMRTSAPHQRWGTPILEEDCDFGYTYQDLSSEPSPVAMRPNVYRKRTPWGGKYISQAEYERAEDRDEDAVSQDGTTIADDSSSFDSTETLDGTLDCISRLNQERREEEGFHYRKGIVDNQEWPPRQDLGELPFKTGRSLPPPRFFNDDACREYGGETFEQSIESFMQELDLISTQQACVVAGMNPVDKLTQTRMYEAGSSRTDHSTTQVVDSMPFVKRRYPPEDSHPAQ